MVANRGVAAGDLVYCKHPWGIGPKDEQFGEEARSLLLPSPFLFFCRAARRSQGETRRFSFLKYTDIAGVVKKDG